VALATAAASLVAATAVTLTIATASSALAQLTSAASRTARLSYDISATIVTVPLRADGPGPAQSVRVSGRLTQRKELARRRSVATRRSSS
jgi:hypothetical protein